MTGPRDSSRFVRSVSAVERTLSRWRTTLSRWAERAFVGRTAARTADSVAAASDTLGRWTRSSWLFGPPDDPQVVVIDLRETYTVGPVLALAGRVGATVGPAWRGSPPRRWLDVAVSTVASAPVRAASALLLGLLVVSLLGTVAAGDAPSGWRLVAAGLALLGTRERRSAAQLADTAAGRAAVALLVPPDTSDRP